MTDVSLRYLLFGEDRTASKSVKGVGHEAVSTSHAVSGALKGMGNAIGGEVGELVNKVSEGLEGLGEHAKGAAPKLIAGGTAITGIGAALQMVGSKDKQATDQLKQAITNAGQSYGQYREEIEKTIHTQEGHARSAVDTQEALRVLVQATGSTQKATESMNVVADLAAAKHISLADAATQVAKIYGGSGSRTLREFGIQLGTSKDKTKNAEDALTALGDKLKGQAAASVDNFGGRIDVIKTKLGDWVAQMGQKVGPVLTALGPIAMGVGSAMQILATRQAAAAVAQEAETGATISGTIAQTAASIASKGWAAAQWLLNAALTANPIGLVVAAIALLVAGFVLAWKHSETFRNFVKGAFDDVAAAAKALWEDGIRPVFKFIIDLWFDVVGALVHGAADAFGWVPGIGGKLKSAARHFDEFRDKVNSALEGVHKSVDVSVEATLDFRTSTPTATGVHVTTIRAALAGGGPVTPGGMYLVGERGPELLSVGASGYVHPNGSMGGDTYNLTVNAGAGADGQSIARVVLASLQDMKRRGMNLGLA